MSICENQEDCVLHHSEIDLLRKQRDDLLAALLWVLWHHQGGSSDTGQTIRKFLGIGKHDRMTDDQVAKAKQFGASVKESA